MVWTLIAWGGRVGLLAVGDDWFDWTRIIGSVLIGVVTAIVLLAPRLREWSQPVLYVFSIWTVLIWTRSMIVNWAGSGTIGFKMVHTLLAFGFGLLVWWSVAFARGNFVPGPDQAHRQ